MKKLLACAALLAVACSQENKSPVDPYITDSEIYTTNLKNRKVYVDAWSFTALMAGLRIWATR